MPNLSEYIRSLKSYNPGITDRAITIYLLKDGWTIDEIEKTFKEINGVTPTPEVSATAPIVVPPVVPTPPSRQAQGTQTPQQAPEPSLNPAIHTLKSDMALQAGGAATNSIPYPTFQEVQQKAGSQAPGSQVPQTKLQQEVAALMPQPPQVPQKPAAEAQTPAAPKSTFGAPVPSLRPSFSYSDIMSGKAEEAAPEAQIKTPPPQPPVIVPQPEPVIPPPPPPQPPQRTIRSIPVSSVPERPTQAPSYGYAPGQFPTTAPAMTAAQAEALARINKKKGVQENPLPKNTSPIVPASQSSAYQSMTQGGGPMFAEPATPVLVPEKHTELRIAHSISHGKTAKILFSILIVILVLGGGGLAFMRYVYGVYVFVQPPFAKEDFVLGFAESLAGMDTAVYEASLSFKTNPREENVEELNISKYADSSDEIISLIPEDASFSAAVTGIYDRTKVAKNGKFGFKGTYTGDGVNLNVDIESIKVEDTAFVRINTFPSFFIDLTSIKDKWISLTRDDFEGTFGSFASILGMSTVDYGFSDAVLPESTIPDGGNSSTKASKEDMKKQYLEALEIANEMQVVEVFGEPIKKVQSDRRAVYEYEVRPNLDNFITFIEKLPAKMQAEFGEASQFKSDPEALAEVKSVEFAYYFNYFRDNTKILVGVDSKGHPAYIDIVNKTAPKDKKFKKQLETNMRIAFSNVNGKNTVKAPTESIPFLDAYSMVTGKSKNDLLFDRVRGSITGIRDAVSTYEKFTGSLPLGLNDLRQSTAQLAQASTTFKNLKLDAYGYTRYEFSTSTRPLYSGSFINVFTEKELTYVRVNNADYQLIYDIRLPSLPKQSYDLLYSIGQYDYDAGGGSAVMYLSFAEGLNTATKKSLSKEADSKKLIDTDKDRVSDALEQYIGTDTGKKDTDGDGVSDYDEIRNGTNPKGNGSWKAGN